MDMCVTHVAFTRLRRAGASDAMLCWKIDVLCSSAASRPACYDPVTCTRPAVPTFTLSTRSRATTRMQLRRSSGLTPVTRMMPSRTIVSKTWVRPAMKTHHGNHVRGQFVSPGGRRASVDVREPRLTNLMFTRFMSARLSAVTSSGGAPCSAAATCSPPAPGACTCNAAPIP